MIKSLSAQGKEISAIGRRALKIIGIVVTLAGVAISSSDRNAGDLPTSKVPHKPHSTITTTDLNRALFTCTRHVARQVVDSETIQHLMKHVLAENFMVGSGILVKRRNLQLKQLRFGGG